MLFWGSGSRPQDDFDLEKGRHFTAKRRKPEDAVSFGPPEGVKNCD